MLGDKYDEWISTLNIVLKNADSKKFEENQKKILDCISNLELHFAEELLKNDDINYRRYAEQTAFDLMEFKKIDSDVLEKYKKEGTLDIDLVIRPERVFRHMTFLLDGILKNSKDFDVLSESDIKNFLSNLTALFYSQIHEPIGIQLLTADEDFQSVFFTSFVQNENGIDNKNVASTEYIDCYFEDVEWGTITKTEAKKFNAEHRSWFMNCLKEPETEFGKKLGKCARIKL